MSAFLRIVGGGVAEKGGIIPIKGGVVPEAPRRLFPHIPASNLKAAVFKS